MKYYTVLLASMLSCYPTLVFAGTAKSLEASSDVIVVGTVTSATFAWPDTIFDLFVEQVVKGNVGNGTLLHVTSGYPYGRDVGVRLVSHTYRGLWFLRVDGTRFRCISARGGEPSPLETTYLPVASTSPLIPEFQPSSDESAPDVIVRLVAAGLEEPNGNPEAVLAAASGLSSPSVVRILRYLSRSADLTKRATGLAGLIERNDKQALLGFLSNRKGFAPRDRDMVAARLLSSFRSTDPDVIAALGVVANDPDAHPSLQAAAAMALRAVHTRETLPYLALLLDTPDLARQIDGVFGLSGFANGFDIQTPGNTASMGWLNNSRPTAYTTVETMDHLLLSFTTDSVKRDEMVSFWKAWWVLNRQQLGY